MHQGLQTLKQKGVKIDALRLKRAIEGINNQQWKNSLIKLLDSILEDVPRRQETKSIQIPRESNPQIEKLGNQMLKAPRITV